MAKWKIIKNRTFWLLKQYSSSNSFQDMVVYIFPLFFSLFSAFLILSCGELWPISWVVSVGLTLITPNYVN